MVRGCDLELDLVPCNVQGRMIEKPTHLGEGWSADAVSKRFPPPLPSGGKQEGAVPEPRRLYESESSSSMAVPCRQGPYFP